jgi:hypothetical protein
MEFSIIYHFTWTDFFLYLLLGIIVLKLTEIVRKNLNIRFISRSFNQKILLSIKRFEIIAEPLLIIFLTVVFISVHIFYNTIILTALTIIFFPGLRDYFTGRIMLFNNNIQINKKIKAQNEIGIIKKRGRFGIQIQNEIGKTYIGYSELFKIGYTLISDNEGSELCILQIKPDKNINLDKFKHHIFEFITTIPYIERSYKPLIKVNNQNDTVKLKILLKKNISAETLLNLFRENNLNCELIQVY